MVNTIIEYIKEGESIIMRMEIYTLESGQMINLMGRAVICLLMGNVSLEL